MIAFFSDRDGNEEIYVMNADGGDQRNLTRHPASDTDPAWSPDGTKIAFSSDRSGNYEIYVMDADGTSPQRLTQNPAVDAQPAWSPDGRRIAFVSLRDGNVEIYTIGADGKDLQRLTRNNFDDWEIDWSPDGSQIAVAAQPGEYANIYIIDLKSNERQQLTDTEAHDCFPRWSPDGSRIAFISNREGNDNWEIYVMDVEGSNLTRLTFADRVDGPPDWSPDGTQLAFDADRDRTAEIYVMNSDGTNLRRLTDNRATDRKPVWQPLDAATGRINRWIRTFEGPDYGAFFDIVLTEDGNVLAVGATNYLHMPPYSGDVLLMKLTLEGELLWERTWGGDGYEQAISVASAGDGGTYVFGETDSYGTGDRDFFLLKLMADGSEDWFKTYGGSGREWPYGMLWLSNGELLVYGFTEIGTGGDRDQYALRLGPDGEVIWEYTAAGPGEELVIDALETADGDLVLAVVVEEDGQLVKLDAGGNVLWTKRYELAGWQYASQIAPTDDGGFLLAGFSMSIGSRRQADTWLARCTPTGELEWETTFGDAAHDDYATSLLRLKDGTYLIGGIGNGLLLSRVDQEGNVLWRRSLVGQTVYGADGLIELEGGGYLVAGFIQIINGRSYDAILLRTDADTAANSAPTIITTPIPAAISVDTAEQVERLSTLRGHRDRVNDLAFSGDGAYLASSSLDKTIKLWDVQTWQQVHAFSMNKVGFNGIAFSPDGRLLASADAIWDVESKQVVHTLERGRNVPSPVAFSRDGSTLAVAPESQSIKLWDVASGELLRTFAEQPDDVTFSIAFSPDGALLAAGVHGGMVRLWDVASGQITGALEHGSEDDDVHDLAFSPDGSVLASAGNDDTVRLWDVASGQVVHVLRHGNGLYGVAFSPDGSLVASACCDRTVKLWDVATGHQVRSLPHGDEVMAVAFSPDGSLLAAGGYDDIVYLWGIRH